MATVVPPWKRPSVWVALMAIAIAGVAAWMLWPRTDPVGGSGATGAPGGSPATTEQAPVQEYLSFVERLQDGSANPPEQSVVVEGLRGLGAALGTMGIGDPELPIDLRLAAEHVVLSPDAAGTTELIRDSLLAAARALEAGGDAATGLRESAEALDPATAVTGQLDHVTRFFLQAAESIRRRGGTST